MITVKENFTVGQKVTTPEGEGVIVKVIGHAVTVHITSTDEEITFEKDKVADDSDAG